MTKHALQIGTFMNRSPLLPIQQRLAGNGLRLMPALGGEWELPAEFSRHGARLEYDAALLSVGVIDRSWRSLLCLTGTDRSSFLQGMVTNDILALKPGHGCHAAFLDTSGHILADLQVWASADSLMISTDPRCAARLAATLNKYLIMEDVQITDLSREWLSLTLQGPQAGALLSQVFSISSLSLTKSGNVPFVLEDGTDGFALLSAAEPTPVYELWMPAAAAMVAWEKLLAAGVAPIGETAAEMLRVEAGTPAWGHELGESVLLPEAEMDDVVSYSKGCYIGQEIIARLQARGHTNRLLRGFLFGHEAPVPALGTTLHVPEDMSEPGREVGRITSAATSPLFNGRTLALAYVRREYGTAGKRLDAQVQQPDGTLFSYSGQVLVRPFVN